MNEVYGVGHFKVENERGGEDSFTVTTCDDGSFCEVRSGDEHGDVVTGNHARAKAMFGHTFDVALDEAFEDWHEKMTPPEKPHYRDGDSGIHPRRPYTYAMPRDPDADGRDDR